jgi:hypothetical protein
MLKHYESNLMYPTHQGLSNGTKITSRCTIIWEISTEIKFQMLKF